MDYQVEVEVSTHDDLKDGVLALPRGPLGSRYRSPERSNLHEEGSSGISTNVVHGPLFSTVVVSADEVSTDGEAMCLAAQIACCTSGAMPTATHLTSWPIKEDS